MEYKFIISYILVCNFVIIATWLRFAHYDATFEVLYVNKNLKEAY